MVRENIPYKTADHEFRSRDEYAQGKYDITTRWLTPLVKPGQILLNIGCGSGEYNATAHELGLRVIACEPEATAFALASQVGTSDVEVLNCGLMDLPGRAPPAHFIVMHDVLEHIENEAAAVEAVSRLLKPGGIAIISVPAYQWLFGAHDVQLGHYRRYTRRTLLPLFSEAFVVEAARYYGAALIPVGLWFSRIKQTSYPVAAVSRGLGHAVLRAVCQFESRVVLPFGTSLMIRAKKSS